MGSGKTNGRRRNSAILFSAVAVALLLTSSLIILNNSSDYSSATTLAPKITYYANNGSTGDGSSRLIKYSGLASTEYNPEYWEGTGYVPVSKELFLKKLVDNGSGTYTINYESIGTNQVVGSREVYVYEGGTYRIYDPYRDGSSNNWVGPAVTNAILIGDITLTIKSGVDSDIVLPSDIVINSVTCSNSNVKKSDANDYTITCQRQPQGQQGVRRVEHLEQWFRLILSSWGCRSLRTDHLALCDVGHPRYLHEEHRHSTEVRRCHSQRCLLSSLLCDHQRDRPDRFRHHIGGVHDQEDLRFRIRQ